MLIYRPFSLIILLHTNSNTMAPSFAQVACSLLFAGSAWAASYSGAEGALLAKRVESPQVLPGTWQYQGCYADGGQRTLSGPTYADQVNMTGGNCIAFCDEKGYAFAGTEYSYECCKYFPMK